MKRLSTIIACITLLTLGACSPDGAFDWLKTEYSIGGAVQKGPYVQGATITIQALNPELKPTGQMYNTQTTNDAGLFALDQINSENVEIIANGFYFDEVEGRISAAPLTLRSIVNLDESTNTNVNLLTTLVYGRIRTLVEKDDKNVAEATSQAERELFLAFGIPEEDHPKRSSSSLNIAEQGDGNGLLIAISVVLQGGRNVGELSEIIAKLSSDLADDGKISPVLISSLPLHQNYGEIAVVVRENLVNRYKNLGVEGAISDFETYLELFKDIDGDGLVDGIEFAILEYDSTSISPLSQSFTLPLLTSSKKCDIVLDKSVDWISVETVDEKYVLNITTNHTGESRTALIVLKDPNSDDTQTFTITQEGYGCAVEYTYDPAASDGEIWIDASAISYGCEYADGKGVFFLSQSPERIYSVRGNCNSITIPESVSWIDFSAFEECLALTKFEGKYATEDGLCLIVDDAIHTFAKSSGATEYTIPNNVAAIAHMAFSSCSTLESVTIPASITHIYSNAFYNHGQLTVTFEGTTPPVIESDAFGSAENLTINVPEEAAMEYLFVVPSNYTDACPNFINLDLSTMPFENAIIYTTTDDEKLTLAFEQQGFGSYYESMLLHVFANGVGIIVLYDEYFKNYSWLGNDIQCLYSDIFREASTLETVILPNNITFIFDEAFFGCTSLTSITIPDSVTACGTGLVGVFEGCTSLKSVHINDIGAWCKIGFGDYSNPLYYAHNLYLNGELITNLVIPDSVTAIGYRAFYGCTSLTSVVIPDSVTKIEYLAFSGCTSLTNVTIGSAVTSIKNNAFDGCSNLTNVTFTGMTPPKLGENAFGPAENLTIKVPLAAIEAYLTCDWPEEYRSACTYNLENECILEYTTDNSSKLDLSAFTNVLSHDYNNGVGKIIFNSPLTTIVEEAFYECTSLTSVTIPDSVTSIGDYAFYYCTSLTSVTIPDSVTSIGHEAFGYCTSLKSITIPDSVTSIGNGAFEHCASLTSVTIPYGVTEIGRSVFRGCTSLTSVTIPDIVTSIGTSAFWGCSSLTSITIPDSVISIGDNAFCGCTSLTSVTIPDSVTSIGEAAFRSCNSLISITIPDSVTSIGNGAFEYCGSLTSVAIPCGVTEIGRSVFGVCTSLTSVTIPDSVTKIGERAFSCCTSLTSIAIPDSVTEIGSWAFEDCRNLSDIIIGNGITTIEACTFYLCHSLTSITIPDSVISIIPGAFYLCENLAEFKGKFASEDGRCLIVDGVLSAFAPAGITEYTIPNDVLTIGADVFRENRTMTSVTILDSVTSIEGGAFEYCRGLQSVHIGANVASIGYHTFYGCKNLLDVYCRPTTPPNNSGTHWIDGLWIAFAENASGRKIYVPTESVEAYKSADGWSVYADAIVGYDFE